MKRRICGIGLIILGGLLVYFYLFGTIPKEEVSVFGLMEKYNHSFGSEFINLLFLMFPGALIVLGIILLNFPSEGKEVKS